MLRILVISLFVANLLLLGFRDDKPVVQPEPKADRAVIKSNNIPTIHLFSEMMEDQDLLSGSRQCFSLGPFHTTEDRDETRLLLLEVSARISERQTQALVEKGYWVFMPPYESLLEANQALFSLQALGLEDIGIVYNGEMKNGISMGYFMRQENALRRKKGLEERGYEPLIRVQRQPESRYWLDYEQTPGSGKVTLDMQNRPNDFMQRPLPCPEEDLFEPVAVESAVAEVDIAPAEETVVEEATQPGESASESAEETAVAEVDIPPLQEVQEEQDELPVESTGTDAESVMTTDDNTAAEEAQVEDDGQTGEGLDTDAVDPAVTVTDTEPVDTSETEDDLPPDQDAGIDAAESTEDLPENNIDGIPEEGAETEPEAGAEAESETVDVDEAIEG